MPAFIDLTGRTFGRLTVLKRSENVRPKRTYWLCRCSCGALKKIGRGNLLRGSTKSCGCLWFDIATAQKGPLASGWRGGRKETKQGYVYIHSPEHPLRDINNYVSEHRLVMEKHLGRLLFRNETIHHKNGIRNDNRLENLELKASRHGRGQSIPDLIFWAAEILKKYAPGMLKQVKTLSSCARQGFVGYINPPASRCRFK